MVSTKNYYPLNAFRICADNIEEDVKGRVLTPLYAETISFSGVGEMLVKMDELFDKVGYPQAFQDKRSFDEDKEPSNLYRGIPECERKMESILGNRGICKTFDVLVTSRRNTSWQGEIYNADGTFLRNFDGEIELLESIVEATQI